MDSENGNNDFQVTEFAGGRVVKPVGSIFRLTSKVISKMTDAELAEHITTVKKSLQTKKQEVDSLNVVLSQATNEVAVREEVERIKLRNIKIQPPKAKAKAKASIDDILNEIVDRLRKKGLSDREIADTLVRLKGAS